MYCILLRQACKRLPLPSPPKRSRFWRGKCKRSVLLLMPDFGEEARPVDTNTDSHALTGVLQKKKKEITQILEIHVLIKKAPITEAEKSATADVSGQ